MCRARDAIHEDIDRLESTSGFGVGRGGFNRHPIEGDELISSREIVAQLPAEVQKEQLFKSLLVRYAGEGGLPGFRRALGASI